MTRTEQVAPLPVHRTVTIVEALPLPPPAPPAPPAPAPEPIRQTTLLIVEPPAAPPGTELIDPAAFASSLPDFGPLTPGGTLIMTEPGAPSARVSAHQTTLITAEELLNRRAAAEVGPRYGHEPATSTGEEPHTKSLPVEVLMHRAGRYAAPNGFEAPPATAARRAGKESVLSGIAATWRETSLPRKASLILMPFVMALFTVAYVKPVLFPKTARRAAPPASVAVARHAASAQVPAAPTAPASAAPAAREEPAPAGDPRVTPQRRAADAIAEGDQTRALVHYRRLARAHPEVAAYREALRILEQRAASAP
jgi:hypothetical protein